MSVKWMKNSHSHTWMEKTRTRGWRLGHEMEMSIKWMEDVQMTGTDRACAVHRPLMPNVSLGISPINWINNDMNDLGDNYSVDAVLADMRDMGFVGTEWCRKFPTEAHLLRPLLDTYGITLAGAWKTVQFSTGVNFEQELQDFRQYARFLKEMGSDYVVVCDGGGSLHWDNPGPRRQVVPYDDTAWIRLAEGLNQAGQYANELGMKLAYHPHVGTNVERPEAIARLLAATDAEVVSIVYDTGHIYAGGGDPLRILERHAHRLACVHLKDVRQDALSRFRERGGTFIEAVRDGLFTVPGDGCIDFRPILKVLSERNYQGWMMIEAEQDPQQAEPRTYAEKAMQYLQSCMQTMR